MMIYALNIVPVSYKLYLIPTFIGETNTEYLPARTISTLQSIKVFIVEREKTARAFLKSVAHPMAQNEFIIHELDKHRSYENFSAFFNKHIAEHDIGVLSEAGLPAIADPGAAVAKYAHKQSVEVVPLSGSSSIFLALMASGLGGQNFIFHGYLPIDNNERIKAIKRMEDNSSKVTQIFMEAPYRNNGLLELLINKCGGSTLLCIAADIETETEFIKTKAIKDWKNEKIDLHKRPCIFVLGR